MRLILCNTPTNLLHENGYADATTQDLILCSFVGLIITLFTIKNPHLFQPRVLYWPTALLSSLLAITPIVILLIAALAVALFAV